MLHAVSARPYHVLVLCTGNSARSIIGESLFNHLGQGRFRGFSAGSHPKGDVHPLALELLQERGLPITGLRSKSWHEFARPGAPPIDFVFTVCDSAAAETCPVWPGVPISAHWGLADPAAVDGSLEARRLAFREAYEALAIRIRRFMALPLDSLDPKSLTSALRDIGRSL